MALQFLILTLDGITAGDYLAWVRDPEPPALGQDLRSVSVHGDPLGDTIEAVLAWRGAAPAPAVAASVAGLHRTPELIKVEAVSRLPQPEDAPAHDAMAEHGQRTRRTTERVVAPMSSRPRSGLPRGSRLRIRSVTPTWPPAGTE
jgi:hypothetical protein